MSDHDFSGFSDFQEDNDWVGAKCQGFVENLPPPLSNLGREYFRRQPWPPHPSFVTAVPFWVGDVYHLPRDVCRSVVLPACLAWVCVRLQDQMMDESENQWIKLSPLSAILFMEMIRQYRALFPVSSSFWNYLEQYLIEWTQSISWEQTDHWNKLHDYSEDDLLLIARKAAMFKLSAIPVALLAGHQEAVEPLTRFVDYTLVAFDLVDQLRDWREDLQNKHYGYLLTKAILGARWSDPTPPSEDFVQRVFLFTDVLDSVMSIAVKYSRLARDCAVHLKGQYLIDYADSLAQHCELILSQIAKDREQAFKNIVEA